MIHIDCHRHAPSMQQLQGFQFHGHHRAEMELHMHLQLQERIKDCGGSVVVASTQSSNKP